MDYRWSYCRQQSRNKLSYAASKAFFPIIRNAHYPSGNRNPGRHLTLESLQFEPLSPRSLRTSKAFIGVMWNLVLSMEALRGMELDLETLALWSNPARINAFVFR